jgi:hypothetical protein
MRIGHPIESQPTLSTQYVFGPTLKDALQPAQPQDAVTSSNFGSICDMAALQMITIGQKQAKATMQISSR